MARTKEFDPEAALDAAMELFWERGYAATSVADLVERLGIARASVYATFGGKHELYLKALDRYLALRDPAVISRLAGPEPALAQVRALVRDYVAEAVGERGRRGCFVVNAAVEAMAADAEVGRRVATSWTTLEVALTLALERGRTLGELRADADPASLARFLLVLLQGVKVLGADGSPAGGERLRAAADQAVAVLDAAAA